MSSENKSRIIYGDAPFIQNMSMLTTLCLLHDEVLLFGSKQLDEQLEDHWKHQEKSGADNKAVVERMLEVLLPEGVVSFYSPDEVPKAFPSNGEIELPGILGLEHVVVDGKGSLLVNVDESKLNDLSRKFIHGFGAETRTVDMFIRDISLLSASLKANIPIASEQAPIDLNLTSSRVHEVATLLSHRTLQKLALPALEAYDPEDILEARLKLKNELQEFRAGILELVWLIHQKVDISTNLNELSRHCDILIDTKIAPAVGQLERAMSAHGSNKVRRILRVSGGVLLEFGKALLTPTLPSTILAGSSALLKVSEELESKQPKIQVASFIYKVKSRRHKSNP